MTVRVNHRDNYRLNAVNPDHPTNAEKQVAADYLREMLDHAGLSQRLFARLLGTNERTVRSWIAGKFPVPYYAQLAAEIEAEHAGHNVEDRSQ